MTLESNKRLATYIESELRRLGVDVPTAAWACGGVHDVCMIGRPRFQSPSASR